MKRVHVLRRPMDVSDVDQLDSDDLDERWVRRADKVRVRRWREIKHQTV